MQRDKKFFGVGLGLGWTALYLARRQLIARLLDLPPVECGVKVERGHEIVMPDGVKLVHDHYRPRNPSQPLPTILIRTPYFRANRYTLIPNTLVANRFAERNYHVIYQDCRGRGDSEGVFEPYVDEAADGRTTIDWITKQSWSDGQVGMFGQSYVGYVQWAAASTQTDALKALTPIITQSQLGRIAEHAYELDLLLRWLLVLDSMENPNLSSLEVMRRYGADVRRQNELLRPGFEAVPLAKADEAIFGRPNPTYRAFVERLDNQEFWDSIDHRDQVATAPPAHFMGGWYDIFIDGLLNDYEAQRDAGLKPYLTVGPYHHLDRQNQVDVLGPSLRWFDYQMKGIDRRREKSVRLFVMGANEWREYDSYPPQTDSTLYYLQGNGFIGGALQQNPPLPTQKPSQYTYNPHQPTPNVGGALLSIEAGAVDNRELEARDDVLVFTTLPLVQDVEIVGRGRVVLYVESSAESADFFARLTVVKPDGKSLNLSDGLYRLKPKRGELQADGSRCISFDLTPTAYRFMAGERIRLQVSSGAYPRYSRNFGVDADLYYDGEMVVGHQTIWHDQVHPSRLILPVTTTG